MRSTSLTVAVIAGAHLAGCCKSSPTPDPTPVASVATATAAPSSSSTSGPTPVCKVESKKVWGSGLNKLTGLTEATLPDGRFAIGVAIGVQPHVLVISKGGEGTLHKVAVKDGTRFGNVPKAAEGRRELMRVTPVKVDASGVRAFVDFSDHFKNKKHLVACGPAESDEWWVVFEDVPFFDREDKSPEATAKLFTKKGSEDGDPAYHEIRDCRTFTDIARGETYVLGSGLHGTLKSDNTVVWKSTFFIDLGAKSHEQHIHSVELKGDPPTMLDYEVPVTGRLKDGSFLVAARNGGRLLVGILDSNKKLKGKFASYAGFPTLPDIAEDGEDLVVSTSVTVSKTDYGLRALRVPGTSPALPDAMTKVITDEGGSGSESNPDFIRDSKGNRWLAHIEGTRGKGTLAIAPMDASFKLVGRPYTVTEENERADSARLMPMTDGGIMVVYLRDAANGSADLVSEEVHCEVMK